MRSLPAPLALLLTVSVFSAYPLSATPIEAAFVGVNGTLAFGFYVGPYYGKLGPQSVVLNCVDFANDVYFGQQWAANLSPIGSQANLVDTRYGAVTNALQLYQEAAWLTQQYHLNPASVYGDIQATIWELFDQVAPAPSSSYWLNMARANYSGGNYNNFFVVTNTGPVNPTGQVQEFLTVLDPSMSIYPSHELNTVADVVAQKSANLDEVAQTPEPAPFGIIGVALICFAGLARWVYRLRFTRPKPTPLQ